MYRIAKAGALGAVATTFLLTGVAYAQGDAVPADCTVAERTLVCSAAPGDDVVVTCGAEKSEGGFGTFSYSDRYAACGGDTPQGSGSIQCAHVAGSDSDPEAGYAYDYGWCDGGLGGPAGYISGGCGSGRYTSDGYIGRGSDCYLAGDDGGGEAYGEIYCDGYEYEGWSAGECGGYGEHPRLGSLDCWSPGHVHPVEAGGGRDLLVVPAGPPDCG